MSEAAENLKPALSSLPESDREELANFLLQSLDQEDSGEDVWDMELLRRMEELETGRERACRLMNFSAACVRSTRETARVSRRCRPRV